MNRRTFATLATACVFCLGTRKLSASVVLPAEPAERDDLIPAQPSPPPAEPERFPVSIEEYESIDPEFLPQLVPYATAELPGTIVIDTDNRFLYLVLESGQAKRYGIGVGRDGFGWSGTATVERKTKWPMWFPPKEMQYRDKEARRWRSGMPGGPRNPLGARALYLFQGKADTLFRIHGTRDPKSIGKAISSGCIRMLNADVVELFDQVPLGTRVVVLPSTRPVAQKAKRSKNATVTQKAKRSKNAIEAQALRRRRNRRRYAAYRRYYRRRYRRSLYGMFGRRDGW
jgi:lipoprotein-anchoring transpeptidase ErfK/SrfK